MDKNTQWHVSDSVPNAFFVVAACVCVCDQTHPPWINIQIVFQQASGIEKAWIPSNILYLLDSPIPPPSVMRHSAVKDRA